MKIDLKFLVYNENIYWWWEDYCAVPRVGETINKNGLFYKVKEVEYISSWVNIIVERM